MSVAVRAHGGEILKFVGDAMLAIFAITDEGAPAACRAAVSAARDALSAMHEWNIAREQDDLAPVRFGVAMHLGDVVYGNIGGTDRLDFTVIGSAVNRAARIESLTATLARPVLVSSTVARHIPDLVSCGVHRLRDIAEPVELFTLPECAAGRPAAPSR
jgi:adenylate cyclase